MNFIQSTTRNGWQTKESFYAYVMAIVDEMRVEGVTGFILIYADGFPGHLCLDLQIWCYENDVILFILLPNATYLMQPLDVNIFRPVKAEYKKQLSAFKIAQKKTEIDQVDLLHVVARTLTKAIVEQPELVKKSFADTGLFPLNGDAVRPERFIGYNPVAPAPSPTVEQQCQSLQEQINKLTSLLQTSQVPVCQISAPTVTASQVPDISGPSTQVAVSQVPDSPVSVVQDSVSQAPSSIVAEDSQDSLSDILSIPEIPAAKTERFKLPRSGNVSSVRVITAYKEHAAQKKVDAEKREIEQRQKLKRRQDAVEQQKLLAEQRLTAKRIKQEKTEEAKKQKALDKELKKKQKEATKMGKPKGAKK
jgi:hypothetical protein